MAKLTAEQLKFIRSMGLSRFDTFDASGMKRAEYKLQMMKDGKIIAYGLSKGCKKMSHTMQWSSGHCAQCNTKALTYIKNNKSPGYIYVVQSESSGQTKVGISKSVPSRRDGLNCQAYSNAKDWVVVFFQKTMVMGVVETTASRLLKAYKVEGEIYRPNSGAVRSSEVFDCTPAVAIRAVKRALSEVENS